MTINYDTTDMKMDSYLALNDTTAANGSWLSSNSRHTLKVTSDSDQLVRLAVHTWPTRGMDASCSL